MADLGAIKHDQEKPQMNLIDPHWLDGIARVLTFGARKYDPHNWRRGFVWSRLYDSLQRHLNAFWMGEDNDEETLESHLLHAACCLMFLWWHVRFGKGKDDRYVSGSPESVDSGIVRPGEEVRVYTGDLVQIMGSTLNSEDRVTVRKPTSIQPTQT